MFRTDTGNFNRFLTSLGLLMLLGALLIPYFYLGDTDTLRIPANELKKLTPVAREALESRQQRNRDLELWILGLAITLAFGGVASLWFGGKRLRTAQKKEDAAIDRKAKRDDVEIQQMSQSEVDEKREEQARESIQGEERGPVRAAVPPPPAQPQQTPSETSLRDSRRAIERIERAVREGLQDGDFRHYEFFHEVKTVSGRQQVRLDGLFRSKDPRSPDVLLDLKVVRQSRFLRGRLRNFADGLLATVTRYERMVPQNAIGWMVVVIPQEVEPIELDERRQLEDQVTHSLVGVAKATVTHESAIPELADRFVQLFETQAK